MMAQNMKEVIKMGKNKEKVYILGLMGQNMMESGMIIKFVEKVFIHGQM
jgi:hypothetical protein